MTDGSAMKVQGMNPVLNMCIARQQLAMNFVVVDGLEREDFLLGRSFIRNFDI